MSEFETIKITNIQHSSYNPRKISNEDYNKLSKSINEFGIISPIIINLKNNHIIGGHQRFDVLYDEYLTNNSFENLNLIRIGDIGWCFPSSDLSVDDLSTEKAMNLALNKISGEWDVPKLETLLIDLDVDDYNLDLTGFDNMDLKEFDIDLKQNIKLETPQESLQKTLKQENNQKETNNETTTTSSSSSNNINQTEENLFDDDISFSETNTDEDKIICPKCGYEIQK